MTKRSQSSIEFMILVAFILFGFLAFFAFIYGSISDNVIKRNQNHRIESIGDDLEVLEIAYGKFDEKDIVRLEDDYGRIK